jgi:5'-3' exonuclease
MSNKILIIDAMNLFIRNYVMNPSLAADGSPIGGTKGFLMSLQKMTRDIQPDNVWSFGMVVAEAKRRTIVKEYKEGRKPLKVKSCIQRNVRIEESQNRYDQMRKTIEYLNQCRCSIND